MTNNDEQDIRTTLRLAPEVYAKVGERSSKLDRSINWWIAKAIEEALIREEHLETIGALESIPPGANLGGFGTYELTLTYSMLRDDMRAYAIRELLIERLSGIVGSDITTRLIALSPMEYVSEDGMEWGMELESETETVS